MSSSADHGQIANHAQLQPASCEMNTQRLDVRRLVVLVPDHGADGNELAHRVWELAAPCELRVLFICALGADGSRESAMRLRLATLAALIRDDRIEVTTQVVLHQNWVTAVRRSCQPGDLVLCCSEQTIPTTACGRQPLCQILEFTLELPVFVLTGLYSEPPEFMTPAHDIAEQIPNWAVLAGLAVVFILAAMQIDQQAAGFARTLLLLVAGLVELGVIVVWGMRT